MKGKLTTSVERIEIARNGIRLPIKPNSKEERFLMEKYGFVSPEDYK